MLLTSRGWGRRAAINGRRALPAALGSALQLKVNCQVESKREISSSLPAFGKVKDFLLADIGEGIAEVEVLEWAVEPGSQVEEFEELLKVQSDKAATEITSPYEGKVVELLVGVGDMAKVGKPLCRIEVEEDDSEPSPGGGEQQSQSVDVAAPTAGESVDEEFKSGKVLTSPAVRRIAKENNIILSNVVGTGPRGRVLKEDVLNYISSGAGVGVGETPGSTSPPAQVATPAAPKKADMAPPSSTFAPVAPAADDQVVDVRGLDRIMVQTMTKAHTVPTLLYTDEFIVNQLQEARSMLKPVATELGVKLTFLPFIVKAASMALLEYPKLNTNVNDDACTQYTIRAAHNIGVAVQTDSGLLVPNVKNVQEKSILQIASDLAELQMMGHNGTLTKEHLQGGTFTISNIGSIGGTVCKPLIVVPEVAIAALGKFQSLPRYNENDELFKATTMNVSISADHRIIDGATVARFSNLWKAYLESPMTMLLHSK
mmetsp:Transcript_35941/g.69451  ORF Transcript_35941/g.69451 Transcript_35941/m.69451 type:complete len:486 (-) Transcript_35941:228-1685(-)